MELWKDFQTSSYYLLDRTEGKQAFCNRYGETPNSFKPYSTGYQQFRVAHTIDADSNYRVQPKKFDGYFQCPRPSSKVSGITRPYTRDNKRYIAKRLPDDIDKLPKPVSSLGFSRVYDKSFKTQISYKIPVKLASEKSTISISDFKSKAQETPQRDIKTASDIFQRHKVEMQNINGYQKPQEKAERRKLKGFFLVDYPTSSALFMQEKKMLEKTNPASYAKQKHFEATDLKKLAKRREQRVLKNKLIQG